MGLGVTGSGIMGLVILYGAFEGVYQSETRYLAGFGFGASAIALFARVGGGIYTKAADVGADLVGKVEMDIPEDDPRNPAVIADNVGDNVGDVAGMGADLFESFVGSIIAAATLAKGDSVLVSLPFWIAGADIVASVIGFFFVSTKDNASQKELLFALHKGTLVASLFVVGFSAIICWQFFENETVGWEIYGCILIGLASYGFLARGNMYVHVTWDRGGSGATQLQQARPGTLAVRS